MRFTALIQSVPRVAGLSLATIVLLSAAGCRKEEVRVYRVPKEKQAPATEAAAAAAAAAHGHGLGAGMPRFTWTTPAGWEAQDSGGVRIVHFVVKGPNGQTADVGAVPLTGAAVPRSDLVNMVRAQVGLEPATEEQLQKTAEKVTIGPIEGDLFEMVSTNALIEDKFKARIVTASAKHNNTLWLFKIAGADDLVRAQRGAFLEFLKSIKFEAASTPGAVAAAPVASPHGAPPVETPDSSKPQWELPAGWQEQPPGTMVIARFAATGEGGKAEIMVSAFPGDTGGLLANVNRWRGQIGLGPIEAGELPKLTEALDAPAGKATLVDMTGTDRKTGQPTRMLGAILPRGGHTWFFKMLGDAPAVGREKAAFLKFLQSVKFPNA